MATDPRVTGVLLWGCESLDKSEGCVVELQSSVF